MAAWREYMEAAGVRLSVYNPKSPLTDVLPLYPRAAARESVHQ